MESITPRLSLEITDDKQDVTEEEFRNIMRGHIPWLIASMLRLVPEVWEWAEEVEEVEDLAA
jgi:hypothetical protein